MISSSTVDKEIRQVVSPLLREHGFTVVRTRNNWRHMEDRIWVFAIRAIGKTGLQNYFPEQSLHCEIEIFFHGFPEHPRPALRTHPKVDKDNRLVPKISECHWRGSLTINNDQSKLRKNIRQKLERTRKDLWWVSEDGSNQEETVADIASSFVRKGLRRLKNAKRATILKNWNSTP